MVVPLTLKLLVEAAHAFERLKKEGFEDVSISVNISSKMIFQSGFLDNITFLLSAYDMHDKPLVFEIMEDTLAQNIDKFSALLGELKEMGLHLAIDDYGTGHVSFDYLLRLPVDEIKIDRSFVREADKESKKRILLESMIHMGKALGFKTVVEGVENEREAEIVKCAGGDLVQGYFYARPMPLEEVMQRLKCNEK
jgi:EAL domain-containing protein (putative c-di-GMP-specific phosphodiesterase class I)